MYDQIISIPILKDNYVWTIINKNDNTACVVDPGESEPVLSYLQKNRLTLKAILLTHHHWDHTNGVADLIKQYDVPVYASTIENIPHVTHPLKESDELNVSTLQFKIIAIPGHTLGHIAFYSPGLIFCGDTLFAAGCGRIFEGTSEQMYTSLNKIASLPDETKIYCAHEYTLNNLQFAEQVEPDNIEIKKRIAAVTKLRQKNLPSIPSLLSDEKATNPFLRCEVPAVIKKIEEHAGMHLHTPVRVFEHMRRWKDSF